MKIARNSDSWIPLENLGQRFPPYRRTFVDGEQEFINDYHGRLAHCPMRNEAVIDFGIPGWLRREDALKLYELAYFIEGEILELGCYAGLSTTIMAHARSDAKKHDPITSVDNKLRRLLSTARTLRQQKLREGVRLRWGDARKAGGKLIQSGRGFGFVFVDDWHSYDSVLGVCRLLPDLLDDGGFCLFHDYNDARNLDPADADYGVSQAVQDGLPNESFEFYGIFGCSALYRKAIRSP